MLWCMVKKLWSVFLRKPFSFRSEHINIVIHRAPSVDSRDMLSADVHVKVYTFPISSSIYGFTTLDDIRRFSLELLKPDSTITTSRSRIT